MDNKLSKRALKRLQRGRQSTFKNDERWTAFRAAEKRYMSRIPPPDLRDVLDLVEEPSLIRQGIHGRMDAIDLKKIDLPRRGTRQRKAYAVPRIPGLVILPNYLSCDEQRSLIRWSLESQARAPNDTNLDIHYVLPEEGLWNCHVRARSSRDELVLKHSVIQPKRPNVLETTDWPPVGPRPLIENVPAEPFNFDALNNLSKPALSPSLHLQPTHASQLLPRLRWANIGYMYHWGSKTYDFSRPKVELPKNIRAICKEVVTAIHWEQVWEGVCDLDWGVRGPQWDTWKDTYEPDTGIVNFYQPKDTLCGHVDRSEVCSTSPLVSISLGNAAIFLMGGLTRTVEPVPILLRSGDILVMSGPRCRRAFHGVPRILEGTLPPHLEFTGLEEDWRLFAEYLGTTRININVRQVFPRGFDPLRGKEQIEQETTTYEEV